MRFLVLEAVDPEERKLRLKKLLQFAHQKRMAGRKASAHAIAMDRTRPWTDPAREVDQKQVGKHYGKARRARAIAQKHTGKDLSVDRNDWNARDPKTRSHKRPLGNRRAAVKVLRADRFARTRHLGLHDFPRAKLKTAASAAAGNWIKRFKQRRR